MPKVNIFLVDSSLQLVPREGYFGKQKNMDLRMLSHGEKEYFREAYTDFRRNIDCWQFEARYLAPGVPLSKLENLISVLGPDMFRRPLYLALEDLWLALGVNQGKMGSRPHETAIRIWI